MIKALAAWSPAPYLNVTAVDREESRWLVTVHSRERACCPVCGAQSSSRHSVCSRALGDLSAQRTPVTIRVRVGRWRCRNERCDRRIFAERLPGIAAPSARLTDRLADIVRPFGHNAGVRPSARLVARLGMCVSHTTIVRRLKQHARTKLKRAANRVVGVDE
jgi:transposase